MTNLKRALEQAKVLADRASDAYRKRHDEVTREANAARDEVFARTKPEIDALSSARWEAKRAWLEARVALNRGEPPIPLGTIMRRWRVDGWRENARLTRLDETGELQVLAEGDPVPDRRTWGEPEVGEIVVRSFLKSGKLGKTVVKYHAPEGSGGGWWPDGVEAHRVETDSRLPIDDEAEGGGA